jgi:hypothetical protein
MEERYTTAKNKATGTGIKIDIMSASNLVRFIG